MITKICPNCEKEFNTYPSINKKHCSAKCSYEMVKKNNYKKFKCYCKQCSVEFLPPRQKEGGLFCSYYCRGVFSRKEHIDREGYWYIFSESHPNRSKQGYVAEHHVIVERDIGRPIPEGYVVHHIDENRKNNELNNLKLMTDSEHKSYHANKRRGDHGHFKTL